MSAHVEKGRMKKIPLWSPLCVITGILMSILIFMIDMDIGRYSSAPPTLTPMYIVALAIITGGFALGIISKFSHENEQGRLRRQIWE